MQYLESPNLTHKEILRRIARRCLLDRGFEPEFNAKIQSELSATVKPFKNTAQLIDYTHLPWCSIDNDDSRDLDQLTVAESLPNEATRIHVAIADVDSIVQRNTALDDHAHQNTTSIYTPGNVFPMLPELLSNDITSLNLNEERAAIVVSMDFSAEGKLLKFTHTQGVVKNHAKLAYNSVAAWLDGTLPKLEAIERVPKLAENLRLQDLVAQKLKELRHTRGALYFETLRANPVFDGTMLKELSKDSKNRAHDIIEDFMIAANSATAVFLQSKKFPVLKRVVKKPKDWDRIVELAAEKGCRLPARPDVVSLSQFLDAEMAANPDSFADLSLAVIKLIGPGIYIAETPEGPTEGHFGLAVDQYAHSTAPNRRYPDIITQRLIKAILANQKAPYSYSDLVALANHCTEMADNAKKVERFLVKSAAALLMEKMIGQSFNGIITGAADKGTWVRLFQIPIEGRIVSGHKGLKVGQKITVTLLSTNVQKGFIDFEAKA